MHTLRSQVVMLPTMSLVIKGNTEPYMSHDDLGGDLRRMLSIVIRKWNSNTIGELEHIIG